MLAECVTECGGDFKKLVLDRLKIGVKDYTIKTDREGIGVQSWHQRRPVEAQLTSDWTLTPWLVVSRSYDEAHAL